MNKTELVATVAEVSGKPKAAVKEVLEALLDQIIKTVKSCLLYTSPSPRDA